MRTGLLLTLALLLAACQVAGPTAGAGTGNPVAGDAIETTTLDAPVVGLAEEQAADNPEPDPPLLPAPVAEPAAPDDPSANPAAAEDPVAIEIPEVIDPALLTSEAIACKRRGGQWSKIGEGNARACIKRTRDAGERCDADRDCQGVCLARSGTCAPVDPLFGCNEVLQDDGRRMTLCLN